MFGRAGLAYVYLVYGMYDCLNIVTEAPGRPAAILVRAVEPIEGVAAIRDARLAWRRARRKGADPAAEAREAARLEATPDALLTRGPGLVAAGFAIDRSMTGLDLLDDRSPLHIEAAAPGEPRPDVVATPRIGIAYAGPPWTEVPWRFVDPASAAVSGPRPARPAPATRSTRA
jgi:DNA-3-methyladenine glycosylase